MGRRALRARQTNRPPTRLWRAVGRNLAHCAGTARPLRGEIAAVRRRCSGRRQRTNGRRSPTAVRTGQNDPLRRDAMLGNDDMIDRLHATLSDRGDIRGRLARARSPRRAAVGRMPRRFGLPTSTVLWLPQRGPWIQRFGCQNPVRIGVIGCGELAQIMHPPTRGASPIPILSRYGGPRPVSRTPARIFREMVALME